MQSRRSGAMARFEGAGWPRDGWRDAIPGAAPAPIRYLEELSPVNEQRNIILAVVLSALVLIGWTFLSERFIPTANPPATKTVNGQQVPLPRPQASPSANTPAVTRDRETVLRSTRESRSTRPGCMARSASRAPGSTTSSSPSIARASPPTRRRSDCCRRPAPPIPISRASAGPARESPCPARTHSGRRAATISLRAAR
jgi:hypothetical protein